MHRGVAEQEGDDAAVPVHPHVVDREGGHEVTAHPDAGPDAETSIDVDVRGLVGDGERGHDAAGVVAGCRVGRHVDGERDLDGLPGGHRDVPLRHGDPLAHAGGLLRGEPQIHRARRGGVAVGGVDVEFDRLGAAVRHDEPVVEVGAGVEGVGEVRAVGAQRVRGGAHGPADVVGRGRGGRRAQERGRGHQRREGQGDETGGEVHGGPSGEAGGEGCSPPARIAGQPASAVRVRVAR